MAPEQWKGEPQDGRTDVFALGVTLFEMLAGSRPYDVRSDRSSVLDPGPEPRLDHPRLPARLRKLIERCIAKDPARRPAGARAALEELLAVERTLAAGEMRRGQLTAVLFLGGVLLALGLAGLAAWKLWPRAVVTGAPRTILIADFQNTTGQDVFDGTLEPALGLALEGATFISSYKRSDAQKVANQLKLEGTGLDGNRARLVARREGIGVVLTGAVAPREKGYEVSVKATDAFTDKEILDATEAVPGKEGVLGATIRLAARVRTALGDATPEGVQMKEAETFSASSLEAAHEYAVGMTLASEGKWDDAIAHYGEAIKLDPGLGRAHTGMGVIEYNRGRHEQGKRMFDEAMAHVDRMTEREKYRTRGLMYLFQRDPEKAIEAFEALVKRFPADNAGAANLAVAYEYKGDFVRALEMGRRAIEISPKNVPQRNNVGFFATYVGDFDAAIREQQKVLELNPRFANGYVGLALAQLASGKRDDAVATWQRLAALDAEGASAAAEGLADLATYEGRLSDARSLLEKGIDSDLSRKHGDAAARKMNMLAGIHVATGQARKAATLAERALKTSDEDAVLLAAAVVLAQSGEEKRARAVADTLDRRVEVEPRMYAEVVRGAVALQRKEFSEAAARFKSAIQRVDSWLARYGLGRAFLEAGAATQAIDEFERLEKRRGEATDAFHNTTPTYRLYPPVLFYLARAQQAGRSPAAVDSYRAFLATQRSDENPLVAVARGAVTAVPATR
jgi:tetratricopeptide (TPR) repeat protein